MKTYAPAAGALQTGSGVVRIIVMPPRRKKTSRSSDAGFRLPGPREFGILEILWRDGPLSVAEIRARLPDSPPLAYTTVMTMLDQLHRKNLVLRRKSGRAFQYTAGMPPERVRQSLAAAFLADFFDSDPVRLAAALPGPTGPPDLRRAGRPRPPRPAPEDGWSRNTQSPPAPPPVEPDDEDDSYLL